MKIARAARVDRKTCFHRTDETPPSGREKYSEIDAHDATGRARAPHRPSRGAALAVPRTMKTSPREDDAAAAAATKRRRVDDGDGEDGDDDDDASSSSSSSSEEEEEDPDDDEDDGSSGSGSGLDLALAEDGRVACPMLLHLRLNAFRAFPRFVRGLPSAHDRDDDDDASTRADADDAARGATLLRRMVRDCETVFTARARKKRGRGDNARASQYSSGSTFWLGADVAPRCALEALARRVFNLHVSGAFYTLVPIRPRRRGERRSLRTFAGVSLRPGSLAFNPRPRRLSTPTDAFQLHPAIALYGTTLRGEGGIRTESSSRSSSLVGVGGAARVRPIAQRRGVVDAGHRREGRDRDALGQGLRPRERERERPSADRDGDVPEARLDWSPYDPVRVVNAIP